MSDKTDFEKIGVNTIRPFRENGRWLFTHQGQKFDLAPAGIMNSVLSPLVIGVDRLIAIGCGMKNIQNPENGFLLLFSTEYFPNADVKFNLHEQRFDGWIYNVEELNLKGLMPGQAAWVCPYLVKYYPEPPKSLYIKIEADDGTPE